jgi:hypothetical protein
MSKLTSFFKKFVLAALVLAIGLVAVPAAGVSALGLQDQAAPPSDQPDNWAVLDPAYHPESCVFPRILSGPGRDNLHLEKIWARTQAAYQCQGVRLAKADEFIARIQSLVDKVNQKGWDTSAIQAALDAFAAVIPAAQAAHDPGAAIIAGHNGFDANGKVIDRAAAIETVKALRQMLKDTRAAMNGTGQALRAAVKAFRDAHRPVQPPTIP